MNAFYYLDSGLLDNLGHHASYCRMIAQEVRSLGMEVRVFGHTGLSPELAAVLGGTSHFRVGTYDRNRFQTDAVAGWIRDFEIACLLTVEDLQRLPKIDADDVVYFNSALPCQLLSVLRWIAGMEIQNRPYVYIELGVDPGLDAINSGTPSDLRFEVRDPRLDPRATLFRYATLDFDTEVHRKVKIFTFNAFVSGIYQILLQTPVQTYEWPHRSLDIQRQWAGALRISFLGHQRHDKGFHLVPGILKELRELAGVQFLVHCGKTSLLAEIQEQVLELVEIMPNLKFDDTIADECYWRFLLSSSDLVVCPYSPNRYASSHSAILSECIANGVPAVVPAGTVLAKMASEHCGMAVEFDGWDAMQIASSIRLAISSYNDLSERATAASSLWATTQGADRLVSRMLSDQLPS